MVEYDTDGFVEKNRDELPREATELLLSSSSSFVKELASIISSTGASEAAKSGRVGPKKSVTVGSHFSKQLTELRAKIDLTSPHYVRCLKPNGLLVPDHFDPLMIVEQLRCAGVVEAVRVSRVGYPQRYNHSQFVARYRTLGIEEMKKATRLRKGKPVEALVNAIATKMAALEAKAQSDLSGGEVKVATDTIDLLEVGIQVGKTKVFLRRRAFDVLEKMRKDYMATAAIKIQAIGRGYIELREFREIKRSSLLLQCWSRMILSRRRVQYLRECTNSRHIQTAWRRSIARRDFLSIKTVVKWCQCMHRGANGRARYDRLNKIRKATIIASYWKALPYAIQYRKIKTSALVVQCAVRCKKSRSMLKELKANAKSLQNVAQERDKMREKMEEMRLELERTKLEAQKEAEAASRLREISSTSNDADMANLKNEINSLEVRLSKATEQIEIEKQITRKAMTEAESKQNELARVETALAAVRSELELALSNLKARDDEIERLNSAQVQPDTSLTDQGVIESLQQKLNDALEELRRKDEEIRQRDEELIMSDTTVPTPKSPQQEKESEQLVSLAEYEMLQEEIKSLQQQLKLLVTKSNTHVEYTSLSQASEIQHLKDENNRLKVELNQATASSNSTQTGDSDQEKDQKEKSKLKREISKLREANKKILDTAEEQYAAFIDMEKENSRLRKDMANLQAEKRGISDSAAYLQLKQESEEAKTSLEAERARTKKTSDTAMNGNRLAYQSISEEEPTNDVKTLQFEIERLRVELAAAKEGKCDEDDGSSNNNTEEHDAVKRLIKEGFEKDIKIKELEARVQSQEAEMKAIQDDDLTFGVRDNYNDENKADMAEAANEGLRSLNDELAKELGLYKQQAVEAVENLIEERKRSDMELKAFSVALKGVDDLRNAAEQMSRELHFIKKNGYVPPNGLSGEDTSESVRNAMSAIESMAVASQSIDHPSLAENDVVTPKQQGFNLWSVMNAVVSPTMLAEEVGSSKGEKKPHKKSSKDKKRRKKRGDEGSIISSFF